MSPSRINTCRGTATWALRGTSLILIATGAYLVLKRLIFGVATHDLASAYGIFEGVGEEQSFCRGVAMLCVGGAIGIGSRRLSRWLVPALPSGCPGCGYAVVEQDRCPECGLTGFKPPVLDQP